MLLIRGFISTLMKKVNERKKKQQPFISLARSKSEVQLKKKEKKKKKIKSIFRFTAFDSVMANI